MKTNRNRRLIRLMRKAFGDFSSSTGCLSPLHCVGCCFELIVVNYWASNDSKRRRGNKLIFNHLETLVMLGVGFAGSFASFSALVASYFYYSHLIERLEWREKLVWSKEEIEKHNRPATEWKQMVCEASLAPSHCKFIKLHRVNQIFKRAATWNSGPKERTRRNL